MHKSSDNIRFELYHSLQQKTIGVIHFFHLSRAYISKLFKAEIGCTTHKYLTDLKLEYSPELLMNGKNVTEACYESGFNNCSVYIEAFKKKFSATPYKFIKGFQ